MEEKNIKKISTYVSLHNHSEYSNLKIIDSINRFNEMVDYAWDNNLRGIAMTEHDCLSGTLFALDVYRKKLDTEWERIHPDEENKHDYEQMSKELKFKVILGNEVYLSEEGTNRKNRKTNHFWHLILLAKDSEGYMQLKQLSSAAWERGWSAGFDMKTPIYPSDLYKFVKGGHLICSTACLGGYAAWCWKQTILDPENMDTYLEKLDNHLEGMTELFGKGNFYIELQPNEVGSEQNIYNSFMVDRYWGKYLFVCTTDSHYLTADEFVLQKGFLRSRPTNAKAKNDGKKENFDFYKYAHMMTPNELKELLLGCSGITEEHVEEMFKNTIEISEKCEFYALEQKPKLATVNYEYWDAYEEDLLKAFAPVITEEEYPNFYYYIHTDYRPDQYLARLVAHGFLNKCKDNWDKKVYYARLEEEFWTLKQVGNKINQPMSDYFTTMEKIIDICWNKAETIVGPERGSAGVFLINYLLGVTQTNPVELNLPFVWRFLHPSRPDLPDIDFDTESIKRERVFTEVKKYFESLGGTVVNVSTFGTSGAKAAINRASKGLDVPDKVASYLSSLVPNERGFDWTLKECYYGNAEKKRNPIAAFVSTIDDYPDLLKLALKIEGLVVSLGVHASGVVCVNDDFNKYNSFLKTKRGQLVTAFDLHTLERTGLVKYDFLTVSALDRIHQCLNYLLEYGEIEWQGSLKATFDKYLSPDVLDYNSSDMWDMVCRGEISSLFQFDTPVGVQAIKDIQPRSLYELAISSSLMRLMSDTGELPLTKYAHYKRVPQLWYDEMSKQGLSAKDVKVLEKYLSRKNGVGESQEVIMQIVMDPEISAFDMTQANKLRKTIAKKQMDQIEVVKQLFYKQGLTVAHASKELLDYVWNFQVTMQLGYSFSEIHTTGYAVIALMEMNLAYRFPTIYWNTACLSIDSSAVSDNDFTNLIENGAITVFDDEQDEEDDDMEDGDEDGDAKKKKKPASNKMKYDNLAVALGRFKTKFNIILPDINLSKLSFTPNVKDNTILYGLKGISKITDPVINEIMSHRPFTSLEDFLSKVTKRIVTKDKVINLIKCGAFSSVEKDLTIKQLLEKFIHSVAGEKKRLTLQNANMLINCGLFPPELQHQCDTYKLTKLMRKNYADENKMWYAVDNLLMPVDKIDAWRKVVADAKNTISEIQGKELEFDGVPRQVIDAGAWNRYYAIESAKLKEYIAKHHQEMLDKLNKILFDAEFYKYCGGDESKWELDSLNFYFTRHPLERTMPQINSELDNLNVQRVNLVNIEDIVEDAMEADSFFIKGKVIPRVKLFTIAGTVIDKNKAKSTVTIQCPTGVIKVKLYRDLFATLCKELDASNDIDDMTVSTNINVGNIDGDDEVAAALPNEETVANAEAQKSFFDKGTQLLVTGHLRGSTFIPKVYKSTGIEAIMKIVLDRDGNLVRLERKED